MNFGKPASLCRHNMNPVSCPTCWREKSPEQKKPAEAPALKQGIPQGYVMPIGEATMRATARAHTATAAPAVNGKEFKPPHSSATNPGHDAHSKDKLWQPPKHGSIIDAQPRHPHLDESNAKTLKV